MSVNLQRKCTEMRVAVCIRDQAASVICDSLGSLRPDQSPGLRDSCSESLSCWRYEAQTLCDVGHAW
jgi:hypothetical protein